MRAPTLTALPLGDSAATLYLGTQQSSSLLKDVHSVAETIRRARLEHVLDIVPAYLGVTVYYDSCRVTYAEMKRLLIDACGSGTAAPGIGTSREHKIPVRYDGLDLRAVSEQTGLTVEAVVEIHSERVYHVDLLGFVPGFAYLSEIDSRLQLPRREQPRPRVEAGSVAIAGLQTAVYPLRTPGGWHIIGRTETVMFDPARREPALLRPGDTVRFEPM